MIKTAIKFLWSLRSNRFPLPWRTAYGSWMLLYNDLQSLSRLRDYEPQVWRFMKSLNLGPNALCLDIGANDGYYTILLTRLGYKVVAFEPVPENCRRLRVNLHLNKLEDIEIVEKVVGSISSPKEDFYVPLRDFSRSSLRTPVELGKEKFTLETVEQICLDDWCKEKVSLIKIDTEGADLEVLKGARRILSEDRPILVVEVVDASTKQFGYKGSEIIEFLELFDYQINSLRGRLEPVTSQQLYHREEVSAIPN